LADGAEEAVTDSSGENSLLLSEKGKFLLPRMEGLDHHQPCVIEKGSERPESE